MSYAHITSFQRNELSGMIQVKAKQKDIAQLLDKNRTTIWRELKKNGTNNKIGYDAGLAKKKVENRRIVANTRFRKIDNNKWLKDYVIDKITKKSELGNQNNHWSPEQISGRLKKDYPDDKSKHIGKDSIYTFIYNERKDLVKYLRCKKGKYRRRYGTKIREKQREEHKKKRIDTRPEIIEKRSRIGDWEGDTIVGSDKSHILTHVDRRSRLVLADKLINGTAELTKQVTIDRFNSLPKKKKYTITYDNGGTFAQHELIERKTGLDIYFAYPYHSWERGCNENTNGLIREFFPKKSSFAMITQEDIDEVVDILNNRPRKCLNYATPNEVFYERS